MTQNITIIVINLVTPKAAAKQKLLFNRPASGLWNIEVGFKQDSNVSPNYNNGLWIWSLFAGLLKSDLDVKQTNKSSCLAQTFGVTKFTIVIDMIWVTLCCDT